MNNEIQLNNFLEQNKNLPINEKVLVIQKFLNSIGAGFSHFGLVDLGNITMQTPRFFIDEKIRKELYNYTDVIEKFLNCEIVFIREL